MIIITILSLIVVISLQHVKQNFNPLTLSRITSIFLFYSAILAFNVLDINCLGSGIGVYSGLYQVTSISQSIEVFIYIIAALILMPWSPSPYSLNTEKLVAGELFLANSQSSRSSQYSPKLAEYCLLILFSTLGSSLLVSSSDLISLYLSIELQSFAVYLLATIYRDSESATAAGLKYFLLGGLSSCFILLGSGLIYSFTGLTNLESITSLISVTSLSSGSSLFQLTDSINISQGYLLGLILIMIGLFFKIAAAPFHNWAPDVYDEVPTIITTWLTIMPKISIVIILLELVSTHSLNVDYLANLDPINYSAGGLTGLNEYSTINIIKNLLLVSSLLSLIIGTVLGLTQIKIKRLLAYSTISHVGFLLLALAVNTEQSIESLLFYLVQYSITNLNTFLILLAFGYIINSSWKQNWNKDSSFTDIRLISELKGQFFSNPLLSLSFAICLLSMAGIPPLMGFFAKQQVLYSASHSGYYFLSIVAILVSVISTYYYLQIIKVSHFDSAIAQDKLESTQKSNSSIPLTNFHSMTISALTLAIILFIINPSILLNSTHLLALSLFTQ